jgi:hypothetical protein
MNTSRTAPRITISGTPELGEHSAAGVTHVLSILSPNSPDPPEFAAFAPHRRLVLRFHDVIEPQPDQIAPTREDVERLLVFGREVSETTEAHLHCALPCRGVALYRGGGVDPDAGRSRMAGQRGTRRGRRDPAARSSNSATRYWAATARSSPPPARSTGAS